MPSTKSISVILALLALMMGFGCVVCAQSASRPDDSDAAARAGMKRDVAPSRFPAEPQTGDRGGEGRSTPNGRAAAIPLKPPTRSDRGNPLAPGAPPSGLRTLLTVGSSLAVVLGLFFVLAWIMRRGAPGSVALLPREAVEVLGRAPLAGRQQVHLIRLGNKLVLISVTPAGAEALSEVTDADEVQRLVALCRQGQPASATSMFRQALERFGREPEPSTHWGEGRAAVGAGRGLRTGGTEGLEGQDDD
jgi:flagellar biogenesis protein FliO